tara:strand:+ start:3707 stop:4303 length:597 start_codon:yes stop_codon:yes gene_type:complete
MPYSAEHKQQTREKIVECARMLFNRHGFEKVSIDMVMERAGLTRGGFYNHFKSKDDLFAAAVDSFLMGRGDRWRTEAGVYDATGPVMAQRMVAAYLSDEHLGDLEDQCPLIALPGDVSRGCVEVQDAYESLLSAMVGLFERSLSPAREDAHETALTLAALCVGGMVLARTLPDANVANAVRAAARTKANALIGEGLPA